MASPPYTMVKHELLSAKANNVEVVSVPADADIAVTAITASWKNIATFWVHEEGAKTSTNTLIGVRESAGGNIAIAFPGPGVRLKHGKDLDITVSATSGIALTVAYHLIAIR